MFWGLIMEPKRRYSQQVKRPFHVSMAALDIFAADDSPTQLMLFFEERNYLLCTLQKGHTVQCPLDLNFEAGDEVIFATNGNCNIHLSGYLQDDQLNYLNGDLEEEDEEEEDEEDEESEVEEKSEKSKRAQRKTKLKVAENEKRASKKLKLEALLNEQFESDDEDDESFTISGADLDEDDDTIEEEEDDDDDEEEEEDDDDDEEASEDEVEQKPVKADAVNGEKPTSTTKKHDKKKNVKDKNETSPTKQNKQQKDQKTSPSPQKRTVEGGIVIQDLRVGEGSIAKPGKLVQVYYEGRLKQNNKLFDQCNKGAGFKFRLGKQEVIKGWDVGVVGMKVGGRRRIVCPPPMAYGQKGSPPAIPPNSTLTFEVELKNVI